MIPIARKTAQEGPDMTHTADVSILQNDPRHGLLTTINVHATGSSSNPLHHTGPRLITGWPRGVFGIALPAVERVLGAVPAPIDYDLYLTLWRSPGTHQSGQWLVNVWGYHDGFPNYEVLIHADGSAWVPLYQYNHGTCDASCLLWPMEVGVNVRDVPGWTN